MSAQKRLLAAANDPVTRSGADQNRAKVKKNADPQAEERACCALKAYFHINDSLPAHLIHGVFIPGRSYPAQIRFANGFGDPAREGHAEDGRALAIKLLDVHAQGRIGAASVSTQDFILLNHPIVLLNDFCRYFPLIASHQGNCFFSQLTHSVALALNTPLRFAAHGTQRDRVKNPLNFNYFSTLPYHLGEQYMIKFSVRPSSIMADEVMVTPSPLDDGMYDALGKVLSERGYALTFAVQCKAVKGMTRVDAISIWHEEDTPFVDVATLFIPPQVLSTPAEREQQEKLTFNPWLTLTEHRPL